MKGPIVSESLKRMSALVTRKIILSGTPMPQGIEDLQPQFDFLYPAEKLRFGDDYLDNFNQSMLEQKRRPWVIPYKLCTTYKNKALPCI